MIRITYVLFPMSDVLFTAWLSSESILTIVEFRRYPAHSCLLTIATLATATCPLGSDCAIWRNGKQARSHQSDDTKTTEKRQRLYKQAVKEMCIQVVVVLVLDFDARESEVVENKVQWCANQSTVVVEGNWTKRKLMSHHHDSPYLQNQIPRHNALVILNLFPDFKFRIWTSTFWSNTRNCLRLDSERNLRHSVCRSVPTCQSQGNKKYCTSISIILISVWYGRKRIWLDWWPSGNPEWCTFPPQQILKFSTDAFDSTRMKVWTVLIG